MTKVLLFTLYTMPLNRQLSMHNVLSLEQIKISCNKVLLTISTVIECV